MALITVRFAVFAGLTIAVALASNLPAVADEFVKVPTDQSSPGNSTGVSGGGPDLQLAKAVYREELLQAWRRNPHLYQAMKDVAANPAAAREWTNRFDWERLQDRTVKGVGKLTISADVPLSGVTGMSLKASKELVSGEMLALNLDERRNAENARGSADMIQDWAAATDLATRYTDLLYSAQSGNDVGLDRHLADFYKTVIKPQSTDFPEVADYAALIGGSKGASDVLARIGITAAEARAIRLRQITLDEVLTGKNTTADAVKQQFFAMYSVQIDAVVGDARSLKNPPGDTLPVDPAKGDPAKYAKRVAEIDATLAASDSGLSEDSRKVLQVYRDGLDAKRRRLLLEAHGEVVRDAKGYALATNAVAQMLFGDSPDLQKMSTAVSSGIDLFDSVGGMLINGALDPTGIGTAMSAVNIAMSLFGGGGGPSAEVQMLRQVLENQRKMLELLTSIDRKVDVLTAKVDEALGLLKELVRGTERGFTQMNVLDERATRRQQEFVQQDQASDDKAMAAGLLKPFRDGAGARYVSGVRCLLDNVCDTEARRLFDDIDNAVGQFGSRMTDALAKDKAYVLDHHYLELEPEVLSKTSNLEVEAMVGDVADLGAWLNVQREARALADLPLVNIDALRHVANPYYFTEVYAPAYADLRTHLPDSYQPERSPDVNGVERELTKIVVAAGAMREGAPLARGVYLASMQDVVSMAFGFLESELGQHNLPKLFEIDVAMKELFHHGTDEEWRAYLNSHSNEDFARLGADAGDFDLRDAKQGRDYYSYIALSKKGVKLNGAQIPSTLQSAVVFRLRKFIAFDDPNDPDSFFDEVVELPIDVALRATVTEVIIKDIHERREAIAADWRKLMAQQDAEWFKGQRAEIQRAALVAKTFLRGGFGSCLEYMSELADGRELIDTLDTMEERLDALPAPENYQQFYGDLIKMQAALHAVPAIPATPLEASCSMGWGNIPLAREAFFRIELQSRSFAASAR